ncbi:MAG TPA: PadR family transcriptional regulator [Gemmatimonadales bacterium]
MHRPRVPELSPLEFHVLLALAGAPLYGYAIRTAVADESSGTLNPPAGSLYRVIGRLMGNGFVRETAEDTDVPRHPGLPRKYYTLTATGRRALATEAHRLRHAALVAEKRLRIVPDRS